jgi:hypothetical protein
VYADTAHALVLRIDGHASEARALAERAHRLARELGDAECVFWSGFRLTGQLNAPRDQAELTQLVDELQSMPHNGVSARSLELVLRVAQVVFLGNGDRARAEACWAELDELASRTLDANLLAWPETHEALQAALDGDLEGALSWLERVESRRVELGSTTAPFAYGGPYTGPEPRLQAQLLLALGRTSEVRIDEETAVSVLAAAGRREEAARRLRDAVADIELAENDSVSTALLGDLLETAVLLEDRTLAPALAVRLAGITASRPRLYALHNVARGRGAAAALVGDRDAAQMAYLQALDWAERIQYRPEVALTRLGMAELLLSGSPDEQEKAREHLDFAIEEFRTMKMQPALERALSHKGLLKA